MREIKFRGKRSDNGEWVYGFYSEILGVEEGYYIINENDEYHVRPKTVGQYTGLKDKNGVEIYEGDVLACGGEDEWYVSGWVRYFDDPICMYAGKFCLADDAEGHISDFWEGNWPEIIEHDEVIGNIHDNPELLEANDEA